MPDRGRYAAVSFEINGKIYCGLGTIGKGKCLDSNYGFFGGVLSRFNF